METGGLSRRGITVRVSTAERSQGREPCEGAGRRYEWSRTTPPYFGNGTSIGGRAKAIAASASKARKARSALDP
jgi:hypothetical protein